MKFLVQGKEVEVIVTKKNIKNIYIRVKENKIYVNANTYTSSKYIESLLEKNRDNIEKMLNQKQNEENNKVYYLGNELKYSYNDKIIINESTCEGPSINFINEYLEKNSLNLFKQRLDRLKNLFKDLPEFKLKIRKMKTRWGVCNKKSMTVTLNTLLIHKDVSLIDYVIIHELCHFKHMNHSEKFWLEVEKYYPYYKKARKMLRG